MAQVAADTEALTVARLALARIDHHEDKCELRWQSVEKKLDNSQADRGEMRAEIAGDFRYLNRVILSGGGATILLLLSIIAYFLQKYGLPGSVG